MHRIREKKRSEERSVKWWSRACVDEAVSRVGIRALNIIFDHSSTPKLRYVRRFLYFYIFYILYFNA